MIAVQLGAARQMKSLSGQSSSCLLLSWKLLGALEQIWRKDCQNPEINGDKEFDTAGGLNTQSFGLARWKLGWVGHIDSICTERNRCCR